MQRDIPIARFTEHLRKLGYPVEGVSKKGDEIRIDCKACTASQLTAAQREAEGFDWAVKPPVDLQAEIDAIKVRLDKLEGR